MIALVTLTFYNKIIYEEYFARTTVTE